MDEEHEEYQDSDEEDEEPTVVHGQSTSKPSTFKQLSFE